MQTAIKVNAKKAKALIESRVFVHNAHIRASSEGFLFYPRFPNSTEWRSLQKEVGKGISETDEGIIKPNFFYVDDMNSSSCIVKWQEGNNNGDFHCQIPLLDSYHVSQVGSLSSQLYANLAGMLIIENDEKVQKDDLAGNFDIDEALRGLIGEGKVNVRGADIYYPAKVVGIRVRNELHYLCLMQNSETLVAFALNPKQHAIRLIQGEKVPSIVSSELEGIVS